MADLRFAFRALSRSPLLSLVVVLSLGLGIGANTAIFSLLYQAVLRSLPVEKPEELVALSYPGEFKGGRSSSGNSGGMDSIFSYRMFRELERNAQGVTGVAGFRQFSANLAFRNRTIDGSVMVVSGRYFPILGVKPHMGRLIEPEDDVHGGGRPVVVLSHGYWQNRLGGASDVLNQPLRVNGNIFTIGRREGSPGPHSAISPTSLFRSPLRHLSLRGGTLRIVGTTIGCTCSQGSSRV